MKLKVQKNNKKTLQEAEAAGRTLDELSREGVKRYKEGDIIKNNEAKSEMETILDKALAKAIEVKRTHKGRVVNPLFIGGAGAGKTAIIEKWAKDQTQFGPDGLYLMTIVSSHLDTGDLGGLRIADRETGKTRRLGIEDFQEMNVRPSVLFLDEINMAKSSVVAQLYKIINEQSDPGDTTGRSRLKRLLFTVGAMNPSEAEMMTYINSLPDDLKSKYDGFDFDVYRGAQPMNHALWSRFVAYWVEPDVDDFKKYIKGSLDAQIDKWSNMQFDENGFEIGADDGDDEDYGWLGITRKEAEDSLKAALGRKEIAMHILNDPRFDWDDYADTNRSRVYGNGRSMMPRDFETALDNCDGTKKDFLASARRNLNSMKYELLVDILSDYTDKNDKANDIFKRYGTQSKMFGGAGVQPRAYDDMKEFGL